jgi:integrase
MSRPSNLRVAPYPHSTTSPWSIEGLKVDGKRKRLFFATEAAAKEELKRIKIKLTKEGAEALNLTDITRVAALHGEKALAGYGKTIGDAIDFYLKHLADAQSSIPISQLANEYIAEKIELGLSEVHLKDLRLRFKAFCEDYGTEGTRTLKAKQVREWLYGLTLSPLSINNFRSRLGSLFTFGVERGYMDRNLIDEIKKKKVVDKPPGILTVDELSRMLAAASPENVPILALGAFAGIRTAELLRLRWENLDLKRGFANIPASKSKTARRRNIRMEPCLQAWLAPYVSSGPIYNGTENTLFPMIRQTSQAASVTWLHNCLRHSYASYSLAKYENAAKLAIDMGHTTTKLIFAVYREVVTPEEAERYFNIFPVENVVEMAA